MTSTPLSILVIESHPLMRAALCAAIADEPDMTIAAVSANGTDIIRTARLLQPNIVLRGLNDPGAEELQTLMVLRKNCPPLQSPKHSVTGGQVCDRVQNSINLREDAPLWRFH